MTHRIVSTCLFAAGALIVLVGIGVALPQAAAAEEDPYEDTGLKTSPKVEVIPVPPGMVGKHNGECKRITRQIQRYAEIADMARDRGDERWEAGTLDQIGRLSERRAQLCPTLYAQKPIGQELAKILKGAAKIAMKLFTMGMI